MPDSTKDAGLEHDSARSSSLHLEACIVIDDGGCEFVADSEEEEDTKEPGDQGSIAFL